MSSQEELLKLALTELTLGAPSECDARGAEVDEVIGGGEADGPREV